MVSHLPDCNILCLPTKYEDKDFMNQIYWMIDIVKECRINVHYQSEWKAKNLNGRNNKIKKDKNWAIEWMNQWVFG